MGSPTFFFERNTGFFLITHARWREFGFACGRMGWNYAYTASLIRAVQTALTSGADILYPDRVQWPK